MSQDVLPNYELLTRVSDGPVRTYHALARTGAVVMAHFVDDHPAGESARARALVERLAPAERRKVLDVAEVAGGVAFVTKFILDFDGFHHWLQTHADAPPASRDDSPTAVAPAPEPPATADGGAGDGPGEFTRAFLSPLGTDVQPASPATQDPTGPAPVAGPPESGRSESLPDPNPGPAAPEPRPAPPDGPGEFTRAFRALTGDPAPLTPTPPRPAEPPASATSPAPTPPAAPAPPPPAVTPPTPTGATAGVAPGTDETTSPPPDGGQGDFTRAFLAIDPAAMPPADSREADIPAAPAPPRPPEAPPPPPEALEPGEFTRVFGNLGQKASPTEGEPGGAPVLPPSPTAPSTPPEALAPGEFTRVFGGIGQPTPDGGDERGEVSGSAPPVPSAVEPSTDDASGAGAPGTPPGAPANPGGAEPGEFTRLFGAITPAPPAGAPPAASAGPSPAGSGGSPSAPGSGPGLPTPNFGLPPTPPPAAPRAPEIKWRDEPAAPPPPASHSLHSDASPPAGPGEFTRIFGRAEVPGNTDVPSSGGLDYRQGAATNPADARRTSDDDYLARLSGQPPAAVPPVQPAPSRDDQIPQPGGPSVPPWLGGGVAPGPAPVPAGPSEFTRVISAQTPPPAPAQPAAPPPAVAPPPVQPAPKTGGVVFLVGIAVTLLLIVAVIVIFLLRSPAPVPADDAVPDAETPTAAPAVDP